MGVRDAATQKGAGWVIASDCGHSSQRPPAVERLHCDLERDRDGPLDEPCSTAPRAISDTQVDVVTVRTLETAPKAASPSSAAI